MTVSTRDRFFFVAAGLVVSASLLVAQGGPSDEDVARRQLESGRSFIRQGNYTEALKDFRAVADTHGTSSVADNALLEIARYYLDTAGNTKDAQAAVDAILKSYPTSDSAPDAYLMGGRLALARSHQPADLEAALANFDRVFRLFPASEVVPRSLVLAGETQWLAGRYDAALAYLARVELEYPNDLAAPAAFLTSGRVLLGLNDPTAAMEELQQARNRWPDSPEAATALAHATLVHRLYVRALKGPAYSASPEQVGPAKLSNVKALAVGKNGAVYWASDSLAGVVTPSNATPPGPAGRFSSFALDTNGGVVLVEQAALRPIGGASMPLAVLRGTGALEALKGADAAVQLSAGEWLVMDDTERGIQKFSRTGTYVGPFAATRVHRMAINASDEIAGLDRDQKAILFFDAAGKNTGKMLLKGTGFDLQNPVDIAYDAFGHLYVLDRGSIAVFTPFGTGPESAPAPVVPGRMATAASTPAPSARTYRLLTLFTEPQSPTAFRRATAFAVDASGAIYLYDDRAERVVVYR